MSPPPPPHPFSVTAYPHPAAMLADISSATAASCSHPPCLPQLSLPLVPSEAPPLPYPPCPSLAPSPSLPPGSPLSCLAPPVPAFWIPLSPPPPHFCFSHPTLPPPLALMLPCYLVPLKISVATCHPALRLAPCPTRLTCPPPHAPLDSCHACLLAEGCGS